MVFLVDDPEGWVTTFGAVCFLGGALAGGAFLEGG
jgi:hypothetical protein